jgi:hypothetical protein
MNARTAPIVDTGAIPAVDSANVREQGLARVHFIAAAEGALTLSALRDKNVGGADRAIDFHRREIHARHALIAGAAARGS